MRRIALLCVLFLQIGITSNLSAQQGARLSIGVRIRVWAPSAGLENVVGSIIGLDADSIRISVQTLTAPVSFQRTALTRLEVSRGRNSHPGRGAVLGFIAGTVTGTLIGHASIRDDYQGDSGDPSPLIGFLVGGVLGTVFGAVIGAAIPPERWLPVPLPIDSKPAQSTTY